MSYIVRNGETLASIAAAQNLYAHDLATANNLPVSAELEPGQQLELPAAAERPSAENLTPEQRTDAALDAYQTAQAQSNGTPGAEANVTQARSDLDAAVAAELSPHVNGVPRNVPGAPSGQQMIDSFRTTILARHADDPAAQQALGASINAFQTEYRADSIAQTDVYGSTVTPQDRLQALSDSLAGQPPEVVRETLLQPSVQRRIDEAAAWVAEPYAGLSGDQARTDAQAAADASQRLADVTVGMPPEFAAAVVERSLPTIRQIAGAEAQSTGSQPFENLSRAVGALGDTPQAQALTRQVAEAYAPQVERWSGFFIDPNMGIVRNAVGNGAHPALSIELANQLNAAGKPDEAGAVLRSAANGARDIQHDLQQKVEAYGEHTQELNWLIQNAGPNLTPEQRQQAIDAYIEGKGEEWRTQLQDLQRGITADAEALLVTTGALTSLPPGIADAAPDIRQTLTEIGTDEATQNGLQFALSLDPSILGTPEAGKAATFLADVGQKGSDFVKNLGNAYVTGHIMPAITSLNPLDPASVSRANAAINDLQTNGARLLGIPQHEIDAGVQRLRTLSDTLSDPRSRITVDQALQNIRGLDTVKGELEGLKNTTFSTGAAATAFRTMALGMSGAAFLTSAQTTIDNPNAQNIIGTLAYSVGLAQDAGAFAATIGVVNAEGRAGTWGLGTSAAGQFTAKFVGVLNAAYFAAGAIDQYNQGSVPGVLFNTAGAGGALLATFGQAAGLGSWAGPVGVGVMIVATAGVALVQYRQDIDKKTDAAEAFYRGAGVDADAINALGNEAAGPAEQLRDALDMSPEQIQQLAAAHPDIFVSPGHAQAAIDVMRAVGVGADDAKTFLDAARQDSPHYAEDFFGQYALRSSDHGEAYMEILRAYVTSAMPSAAAVANGVSPELSDPSAQQAQQARVEYESSPAGDSNALGVVLWNNPDPAFRAEVIRLLKEDGLLDHFVSQTANELGYNSDRTDTARSAIEAARDSGVLSDDEAQGYLDQLPG